MCRINKAQRFFRSAFQIKNPISKLKYSHFFPVQIFVWGLHQSYLKIRSYNGNGDTALSEATEIGTTLILLLKCSLLDKVHYQNIIFKSEMHSAEHVFSFCKQIFSLPELSVQSTKQSSITLEKCHLIHKVKFFK